jgi:hypothetical protein
MHDSYQLDHYKVYSIISNDPRHLHKSLIFIFEHFDSPFILLLKAIEIEFLRPVILI